MRIGCDIGGVVKNLNDDTPITDAIETILRLHKAGHMIKFISKCGSSYAALTVDWLAKHGLSEFEIQFCESYSGKVNLARSLGIQIMIDDKMTVLKHFEGGLFERIWFCKEQKNIDGARRYDPEFVRTVRLVQSWSEIEEIVRDMETI